MSKEKYKPLPKSGLYYSNTIWMSPAYQSLTKSAMNLLQCLVGELRWTRLGKKGKKKKVYLNNGEVSFPQSVYTEFFNSSKATYVSARNQLIRVGFIKLVYKGGLGRGDCARYKILCLQETLFKHERWRGYPEKNWEHEIPKPKKQLVGVETQWKKGQSGRKKPKATLSK